MVKALSSKVFGTETQSIVRIANGVGERWTVVTTSSASEGTHTFGGGGDDDCYQVEVINLASYNGSSLNGEARIALAENETANSGDYLFLPSGASAIVDVANLSSIRYKRDAATNVSLLFRERRC